MDGQSWWSSKDSITGIILRWLWPAAILIPCILGILELVGAQEGWYSYTSGIALFAIATMALFSFAIALTAYLVNVAENKLRQNEKLARLQVENRKDYAIYMLDPEGNVMSWNAGAERLLGYDASEILGKNFERFFLLEDQQRNKPRSLLQHTLDQKQAESEGWRVRRNGGRFWATSTLSAVFDENHILVGYTNLIRNSTRQKEADDRLKQLVSSLERSNQELERFAYIASHDLQEPLRMVSSYTQLLAKKYKDKLDPEAVEFIDFAVDGAMRMQQLITDLLTYSRVATKGKPFAPTNCNSIVDQAIRNLGIAIKEAQAEVTHDNLPNIVADETQMLQLFQNLLSNAIKFHDKTPPKVHIGVRQENNSWIFSIQDNGIGIAPEYQEQIFLIFQRLHSRKEYQGTGVGLAICKKIVERHGGKIWVVSEPGKGATFCFTLPT